MENTMTKSIFDHMEEFLLTNPINPISQKPVLVAKDTTFSKEYSDDAYNLLLPLASENTYAYIKTYIENETNMPKRVIAVSELPNIEGEEDGSFKFVPPHANSEQWKLMKGARYVPRLIEYFSPEKNKNLYKSITNANVLIPPVKIFDTDKVQYQATSGYVEIVHLKTNYEGVAYTYNLLKSYRSQSAGTTTTPPKVFTLLHEEYEFFHNFLCWAQKAYALTLQDASIEQARVRVATLAIHNTLNKRKAEAGDVDKAPPKRVRRAPAAKKTKQQTITQNSSAIKGPSATSMFAGLKAVAERQHSIKPVIEIPGSSNIVTEIGDDYEENAQNPFDVY